MDWIVNFEVMLTKKKEKTEKEKEVKKTTEPIGGQNDQKNSMLSCLFLG